MTGMSSYINDLIFVMILFLPLYCAGRIFMMLRRRAAYGKNPAVTHAQAAAREIVLAAFVLFMLGLLTLTFEDGQEWMQARSLPQAIERFQKGVGVNKVPFHTIHTYIRHMTNIEYLWVNIAGNVVLFIPWGLCLPLLWKKYQSIFGVAVMSVILPVMIEFCQLFVGRTVDIDDVILNFAGGVLGGLLFFLLRRGFPDLGKLAR